MADNCRMCHPQQIHLHFNRGLECLNWQEKEVVAVRTSGFMGGGSGKANWDVSKEFPLSFLSHCRRRGCHLLPWEADVSVSQSGRLDIPLKVLILGFDFPSSINPNVELKCLLLKFELFFFRFCLSEGEEQAAITLLIKLSFLYVKTVIQDQSLWEIQPRFF